MIFEDTIAAISTPIGVGGIGIVRVSGKDAITIVDKIFKAGDHIKLSDKQTHTITYGHIVNKEGQVLDEVLVMLMKAPRTFTRENIVEINCHGGPVPLNAVLMATIEAGAKLAGNGEFTKRAFLNGRIDLAQVEAVMDIIEAKTERSLSQAIGQLEGHLSREIKKYQSQLMQIIAQIEVSIDYPEYDEANYLPQSFEIAVKELNKHLQVLLKTANVGKMIREGVKTAIIGKPNVGKSSLLNALLKENKAIVTNIPGTTRDVVEAYLNIDGIPFQLLDTAGIRDAEDQVEQIGVERSKQVSKEADLILMLTDVYTGITKDDQAILESIQDKPIIYICNKIDLKKDFNEAMVMKYFRKEAVVFISALEQRGIDELKIKMKEMILKGQSGLNTQVTLSNQRQKQALLYAIQSLNRVIEAIKQGMPEDCLAIDLHEAYGHLGMIVGDSLKEEIIDQLFSRFCLGK